MGEYCNVYTIQWYEYELLHFARCGEFYEVGLHVHVVLILYYMYTITFRRHCHNACPLGI